jgi:cytochrome c oxidase subunit 2
VVESPEAFHQWLTDAAKQPAIAAYNPASDEYNKRSRNQWQIVVPAAPPVVNYSN